MHVDANIITTNTDCILDKSTTHCLCKHQNDPIAVININECGHGQSILPTIG